MSLVARTIVTFVFLLLGATWLLSPAAQAASQEQAPQVNFELVPIQVGPHNLEVKLANTFETRAHGLMYAKSANPGMLLMYQEPRVMTLWMKNTYIPLDVAFFDKKGKIVRIVQMQPLSETVHSSKQKVIGALEMDLGWFAKNNINVGDKIIYK